MKKALLLFLQIFILVFSACGAEPAPDSSQEQELYTYWKSIYDEAMAGWQPAQLFSTKEYTYGIDELNITQNNDGSYTVSFVFGAVFNLFIGDYTPDSRLRMATLYYPELYAGEDAAEGLKLARIYPAGDGTMNTIGPYLTGYEYICAEKPEALYFKTPEFRVIDMHAQLLVDDPSLYTIEYMAPYTHNGKTLTPVNFILGESLSGEWDKAALRMDDTELSAELNRSGYDYFPFELPENAQLDAGYTLTLSGEYLGISRQLFEIDMD